MGNFIFYQFKQVHLIGQQACLNWFVWKGIILGANVLDDSNECKTVTGR